MPAPRPNPRGFDGSTFAVLMISMGNVWKPPHDFTGKQLVLRPNIGLNGLIFTLVVDLLFFRLKYTRYQTVLVRTSKIHGSTSSLYMIWYQALTAGAALRNEHDSISCYNSINIRLIGLWVIQSPQCDPIPSFRLLLFDLKNESIFCSPILQHRSLIK